MKHLHMLFFQDLFEGLSKRVQHPHLCYLRYLIRCNNVFEGIFIYGSSHKLWLTYELLSIQNLTSSFDVSVQSLFFNIIPIFI